MDATLRGADRDAWSAADIAAADAALARVQEAVRQADGLIDGYLVQRGYTVPLAPVHELVSVWSCDIARYLLHKDRIGDERSDPIARGYRDALKLLQQLADGKFSLGAGDPLATAPDTDVRFASDAKVFSRHELRSFR